MDNPKRPVITIKKKPALAGLLSGLSAADRAELAKMLAAQADDPEAPPVVSVATAKEVELYRGVPRDMTVDTPLDLSPPAVDLSKLPPNGSRSSAPVSPPARVWGDPRWLKP